MTDDLKKDEQAALTGERKYYTLEADFALESAPIREWVNKQEQMQDFHPRSSEPFGGLRFSEPPQIKFNRAGRRGVLLDADSINLGTWLVSDRLMAIFERLDPEACVFQCVDVDYSNFPQPGPGYWFCYFMRELDCVDEERSVIGYQKDIAWKNYVDLIDVRMRQEAVGSAHAFRLKYARMKSIVDDVVAGALQEAKIRGFKFQPIQKQ